MKEIKFTPKDNLVFDLKVVEACRNCKRHGTKASCPPYVFETHYYRKLLPTYKYGIIYYEEFPADKEQWEKYGKISSLTLQKFLLKKRDELFNSGHTFVTAFGSGSCKVCPKCSFPCRFPAKSLVPFEATGVDVVKTLNNLGLKIVFPVKGTFYRVGVVLYD